MPRKLLSLFLLLLACGAQAQDVASMLTKRYQELNSAIARRDIKAVEGWVRAHVDAKFQYTSRDKKKFDRSSFLAGMREQVMVLERVETATVVVRNAKVGAGKTTLDTLSDLKGIVTFDGKKLTLKDQSKTTDEWVKRGNDWKLIKSTQTSADTQLFAK